MRLAPRLVLRLRRIPPRDALVLAGWAGVVALLEQYGGLAVTDLQDLGAVALVAVLAVLTVRWHRRGPLGCVAWMQGQARALGVRLRRITLEVGIDLRETPPYPRRVPPLYWGLTAGAVLFGALAWSGARGLPGGLREALAARTYTGYLLLLTLLWGLLLAGTLVMLFIPCATLHDACVRRHHGRGKRPLLPEVLGAAGIVSAAVILGLAFPPGIALEALILLFAATTALVLLPGTPRFTLLWRPRGVDGGLRSVDYRWLMFAEVAFLVWLSCGLGCTAAGQAIRGGEAGGFPLTQTLGRIYLWAALGAVVTLFGLIVRSLWIGWRLAAARDVPVAYVLGAGWRRRAVARAFRAAGWRVRFAPARRRPADVPVALGQTAAPPGAIRLSWRALRDESTFVRLRRRDEIQKRRLLMRGLEKLFKRAAGREFRAGEGFWLGLQHWYILGLSRDAEEEELDIHHGTLLSETVGPLYHRMFPPVVRRYYARVMRALAVDLIFVEDGVGFRRLKRVLQVLFEVYDVYGGRQRAEEKHFLGLPGVRVLIHDVLLGQPWLEPRYPEPDYEDVGRARILHVFKDRGGEEEPLDVPGDREALPVSFPAR